MPEPVSKQDYEQNLIRWSVQCPDEAQELQSLNPEHAVPFLSESGEANLRSHDRGEDFALYDSPSPSKEAEKWFQSLDLYGVKTLVVYGIGLGYYYEAAKNWLQENPERVLLFLEDDLEVLHHLFSHSTGNALLRDSQVKIHFIHTPESRLIENLRQGGELRKDLDKLPFVLFQKPYRLAALESYRTRFPALLCTLEQELDLIKNIKLYDLLEQVRFGLPFYQSFYRNVLDLPQSYRGDALSGKFKGVPAIVCGAGPSLGKNVHLLKELKNRALIFAGGTAMNAVNAAGVLPHFGVGIDPNWHQFTRLVMNDAFQVPYFYRNRIFPAALQLIQGDHLLVSGSGGYNISNWLEKKLGLEEGKVSEGMNVVNFSLSIAHLLGCSPIILVGVDLAYTDNASYAPGLVNYPLHHFKQDFRTKGDADELMVRKDIDGNNVLTLWKWVMEADWYARYVQPYPDLKVINATEGGIGMPGIENLNLQEVDQRYLKEDYDLESRIHAAIQQSGMGEEVTRSRIVHTLQEMEESLTACERMCGEAKESFEKILEGIEKGELPVPEIPPPETAELLRRLKEEPAYQYIIGGFSETYLRYYGTKAELPEKLDGESALKYQQAAYHMERYEFLRVAAVKNRKLLQDTIQNEEIRHRVEEQMKVEGVPPSLNREEAEAFLSSKPEGDICREIGESGGVLAECYEANGLKEGYAIRYYENGALYCILQYHEGVQDGVQEYYYSDGNVRSVLSYLGGKLHGAVTLYYRHGCKKREVYYRDGVRDGVEKLWNMAGNLENKVEYRMGKPHGTARAWYANGQLSKEVVYDENGEVAAQRRWTANGALVPEHLYVREDFYDKVTKQTRLLTEAISQIANKAGNMLPQKELEELQENLRKMEELEEKMGEKNNKEDLWKTPTAKRLIGKQLEEATQKMTRDIESMEALLGKAADAMKKKEKNNDESSL